jgi:GNAT superfamily N-acetyltransferase
MQTADSATSSVVIRPVSSSRDLKRWIRFPYSIYPVDGPWVAPLEREIRRRVSRKNPYFQHAEFEQLLAVDAAGRVRGRILAHVDYRHVVRWSENVGFFGFFECEDDPAVAKALLDAAGRFARERGCDRLRGPFNLNAYQELGILVAGFAEIQSVGETHTPPYYPRLLEAAGLAPSKHLSTFSCPLDKLDPAQLIGPKQKALLDDPSFAIRCYRPSEFDREIARFGDIMNVSFYEAWHFVPVTKEQLLFDYGAIKPLLRPELVLVAELRGVPVGFNIGVPNVYELLRPLRGRLPPHRLLGLLRGVKKLRQVTACMSGVVPHLHVRGIYRLLIAKLIENAKRMGFDTLYGMAHDDNPGPMAVAAKVAQRKHHLAVYERPL